MTKSIKNQTHPHPHSDRPTETERAVLWTCGCGSIGTVLVVLWLWIVACGSLIGDRGLERWFHHRRYRHRCMWIGAGSVDRCLWVDRDRWCLWVLMVVVLVMECWSDCERKKRKKKKEETTDKKKERRRIRKRNSRDKIILEKEYKNIIYIKYSV